LLIGGIFFFHRDTFTRVSELALVVFSVLFSVVLAKGVLVFTHSPLYLPVALAPALIGLLLRPRLGVLVTIFMAVMMGLLTQMNLAVIFGTLVSGIATSFTTIDVRRRAQYFRIGIVAGLMYMATVFCVSILSDEQSLQWALRTSQPAWVGGLALIPILFILLPILEHVFGLTTNVSLIELSDRNHPLLKRMALEAPGTFHHSLMVAQLAESACEEVGANGLLARVGAYFHDIGKIDKAKYFTENQNQRDRNIHDYLIPEESCSIITSHVSDGLKLAKKHKLKRCIVDFIPQHHGTALIYYFYRKAQDQSAERIEDDQLYRHIGPKPQTKETAVVLLADSAEAASRSLEDVTPEEIRSMVKKIIQHKLLDGQLDEADLTTRDLKKVEDSFTTTLLGVLHSRVKYPDLVVPSETAKANA